MDRTIQAVLTETTVVTKTLDDFFCHLTETREARIDSEERANKAQIMKDRVVEENCRENRATVKKII